jgi:hypothetical protein
MFINLVAQHYSASNILREGKNNETSGSRTEALESSRDESPVASKSGWNGTEKGIIKDEVKGVLFFPKLEKDEHGE